LGPVLFEFVVGLGGGRISSSLAPDFDGPDGETSSFDLVPVAGGGGELEPDDLGETPPPFVSVLVVGSVAVDGGAFPSSRGLVTAPDFFDGLDVGERFDLVSGFITTDTPLGPP